MVVQHKMGYGANVILVFGFPARTSHFQDSDERLRFSNMTGFAEGVYIRW